MVNHTKQQLPEHFCAWLAGIIDGKANFDFRRNVLKSIRIKLHVRDIRILKRIQNLLHVGRVRVVKGTAYVMYIVSSKSDNTRLLTCINGHIRIKQQAFEKACDYLNLRFHKPRQLLRYDAYLAGLIDSDGSVVLNFKQNCITVAVEVNLTQYTEHLNFDFVIPYTKPNRVVRTTASGKKSIRFIYQAVKKLAPVYDYFKRVRLYSDFKYYRVMKIKKFLTLRHFKSSAYGSVEYRIYSEFCLDFIMYQNPKWTKVPLVAKLDKDIVHR